ncbi:MAG: MTH938/NDUFAF3 family protein [Candidatus Dormibacteria bacterium]
MHFESFSFGSIQIDGVIYEHDLVIDRGEIRKRKKRGSKEYRAAYGHTPLSVKEVIPWRCRRLVVGTGAQGALPVMDGVRHEAKLRKVELLSLPTAEAIAILNRGAKDTKGGPHVTC